jgi:hypothetical protein
MIIEMERNYYSYSFIYPFQSKAWLKGQACNDNNNVYACKEPWSICWQTWLQQKYKPKTMIWHRLGHTNNDIEFQCV